MRENNPLDRIDFWVEKIKKGIEEQASLAKNAGFSSVSEARELYLINKIATLTVAMEELAQRIEFLEASNKK